QRLRRGPDWWTSPPENPGGRGSGSRLDTPTFARARWSASRSDPDADHPLRDTPGPAHVAGTRGGTRDTAGCRDGVFPPRRRPRHVADRRARGTRLRLAHQRALLLVADTAQIG